VFEHLSQKFNKDNENVSRNYLLPHAINAKLQTQKPWLQELVSSLINSELFYGSSTLIYTFLRCQLRNIIGYHSRPALLIAGFIACGVGSTFEDITQLPNALLYQGKDALIILGNMATARKLLPKLDESIAYTLTFSIGLAILNYYHTMDADICPVLIKMLLEKIVGKEGVKDNIEDFLRTYLEKKQIIQRGIIRSTNWTVLDVCLGTIKNFGTGYLIGLILGIFVTPQWKIGPVIKSASQSGFNTACFLASLLAVYRVLSILLRSLNKKLSSLIIGFVSAWTMLISRYKLGATLSLSYAISCILKDGVQRGIIPNIPYSSSILYGLIGGISIYAVQFENYSVPESAQEFLATLAGSDHHFLKKIRSRIIKDYQIPV